MYQQIPFSALVASLIILLPAFVYFCLGMSKGRCVMQRHHRTEQHQRFLQDNIQFLTRVTGCIWAALTVFFTFVFSSGASTEHPILNVICISLTAYITIKFVRHYHTVGFYQALSTQID